MVGLILGWVAMAKLRSVRRDQRILLPDGTSAGLVDRQATLAQAMQQLTDGLAAARAETAAVGARTDLALRTAIRSHGLVRFNAFGDLGGHQSWSLALLDATRTGAVITVLYGREETRMYVKQLHDGVPDRELSDEESQAVATATSARGAA